MRSATKCVYLPALDISVSIHALLAECDIGVPLRLNVLLRFNPRTPCGVRQEKTTESRQRRRVSIHALLAECDTTLPCLKSWTCGFNPRTPCGVRHHDMRAYMDAQTFQSTHSLRSATIRKCPFCVVREVSIHALLAECDEDGVKGPSVLGTFQSTHSLRSATGACITNNSL